MARGKFIVFEGIDGSGLTTQAGLLRGWIESQGRECYLTKEPSDGPAGSVIRLVLANRLSLGSEALALLFAADRVDHLATDIEPKLAAGINVISDRYYLSSLAYQSLDCDLSWLRDINRLVIAPDLTILMNTPPELSVKRIQRNRWHIELFEDVLTLERVRQRYLAVARDLVAHEGLRIAVLDGSDPLEKVRKQVRTLAATLFASAGRSSQNRPLDQLALIPGESGQGSP